MADSTRAMRRSIFEWERLPVWTNRLLTEITPDDLRAYSRKIVDRGAPCPRHPQADLQVCDLARREVRQSRRRCRPRLDRDICSRELVAVADGNLRDVQAAPLCGYAANDPARDASLAADNGAQERAAGCVARSIFDRRAVARRSASQASTSARSHTTQRRLSAKRRGNSPRCSTS